jgi:ABC-type multidrug transport system fused ATPase/permease subunit
LSVFFGSLIQIVVFSGYILLSNLNIVLIFAGGVLILFIPTFLLTKLGRKYAHTAYVSMNQISKDIEKVLDNLFLIKILKFVNKELQNFENSLQKFYKSRVNEVKVGTVNALMPNFFTLFLLSILIVFFDFIKFLTFDFIGILLRLFQSLGIFNKNIHTVSSYHVYLERLYEIESNKDNINFDNFKLIDDKNSISAIEIKELSFRYLGMSEDMFCNLNIKIPKNEHTIITGPNGSGKSTLLGLMTGIFYPTEGDVIANVHKFGYVSATPMILNASLRENLIYGAETTISDSELINLISEFKLFNEVSPDTLDKKISNKSLSTGQMQKVSFIRALASGIDLLVLDESTSNLDIQTKEIIFSVIRSQNITVINSTHNPEDFKSIDNQIIIHLNDEQRTVEFIKL